MKSMKYTITLLLLLCGISQLAAQRVVSSTGRIDEEILVQLQHNEDIDNFMEFLQHSDGALGKLTLIRQVGKHSHTFLLKNPNPPQENEDLLLRLASAPYILSVQFNYWLETRETPNDANYGEQWDMDIIQAPQAWEIATGGLSALGDTIVLAIVDSGFDINHPDLRDNIWHNYAEIPDDTIDNDNNGYTDDNIGWNFREGNNAIPISSHGHAVAGIAGAKGNNNIGVTGVNWNVKLMLLATEKVDQVIEAYEYVIDQRERYNTSNGAEGAFVVATNASIGKSLFFCDDFAAWGAMYDLMGQVGVLTGAGTSNSPYNVEIDGDMPTTCPSDYIITVLNTTMNDSKAQLSAYGATSIDMGSPGDASYTIALGNGYGAFGGNSAAAPHLAGAIALMYSLPCESLASSAIKQPAQTALIVREALLHGVDTILALKGLTATGGRLNVFKSMEYMQEFCGTTTGPLDIVKIYPNPVKTELKILIETPDFEAGYAIKIYNSLGQEVYSNAFAPIRFGPKLFNISVANWAPGPYFVSLSYGKNQVTRKIVVM